MAMGTSINVEMHQMDVATSFLYAPIDEELYMQKLEEMV